MRGLTPSHFILVAATVPVLSFVVPAHGAWESEPEIALRAGTADNVLLQPDAFGQLQQDTQNTTLDARVRLTAFNERGFVIFTPRVQSNKYSDDLYTAIEREDWYLDGKAAYRWEAADIGFRANYRDQSIQRSELPDIDDPVIGPDGEIIEEPEEADSGRLVFAEETRERTLLQPYVGFRISPRSTLRFTLSSTEVSYSGGSNVARTSFDDQSLSVGVNRRVNDQNTVSATLLVANYEANANNNVTDTVGVDGAINRIVSDLWTVSVTAGVRRSDFTFDTLAPGRPVVDNAEVNPTFGVRATKRSELGLLNLRFAQLMGPNSSGFVTERDELHIYWNRYLTQRLSARVGIELYETSAVGDAAPINDRSYTRGEFSLDWALGQRIFLTGGYHYTGQEFTQQSTGKTNSRAIFIGLVYRGLSRPGVPR
jgi:hypothetical protein